MTLEYIPLKQFSKHIRAGWKLACELKPGDWAAVMMPPLPAPSNRVKAAEDRWAKARKAEARA